MGVPLNHFFCRIFPYKPSIVVYPHLWRPPYLHLNLCLWLEPRCTISASQQRRPWWTTPTSWSTPLRRWLSPLVQWLCEELMWALWRILEFLFEAYLDFSSTLSCFLNDSEPVHLAPLIFPNIEPMFKYRVASISTTHQQRDTSKCRQHV